MRILRSRLRTQGSSRRGNEGLTEGDAVWEWLTPARLSAVIFLKLCILFALAVNSIIVMDEFVQLGWAKYLQNGMFETVWPVKAIGYAVFYKLAHLLGWDATSTVLIGRIMTAILGVGIVIMIYACSRALAWSRAEALLVVVVLLSYSNFIERIFRTRAEPLAVFFAVGSLLVLASGKLAARKIIFAGVLTGLAFVTTQKSIYFNVALGGALVIDGLIRRELVDAIWRGGLLFCGWLIPVAAYVSAFGGFDPLPVLKNLLFGPAALVYDVPQFYNGMEKFLIETFLRNALLYLICVFGLISAACDISKLESNKRVTLIFSMVTCILVFSHNQPWPYLFVMALPFLSIWVIYALRSSSPFVRKILTVAIIIAVASSFIRNFHYLRDFGNSHQLAVVQSAEKLTGANDRYFDGVGMLPNRSEPSTLWLDVPLVWRSIQEQKQSELYEIFSRTPPKTIIWSYRMEAVAPVIQEVLDASYTKVSPNILMAGRNLKINVPVNFVPPISGQYNLYSRDGLPLRGTVSLDGKVVSLPLKLGRHNYHVELLNGPDRALLVPVGDYRHVFDADAPNKILFAKTYD